MLLWHTFAHSCPRQKTENRGWGLSISTFFWVNGLVPLFLVIPLMPFLLEDKKPKEVGVLKRHTDELWTLVQKRAVWRPMMFVYIYNALMVSEVAGVCDGGQFLIPCFRLLLLVLVPWFLVWWLKPFMFEIMKLFESRDTKLNSSVVHLHVVLTASSSVIRPAVFMPPSLHVLVCIIQLCVVYTKLNTFRSC